jgi:hypothetical protein
MLILPGIVAASGRIVKSADIEPAPPWLVSATLAALALRLRVLRLQHWKPLFAVGLA